MKHVIQHGLDRSQSKQIAEKAFSEYQQRFAKYSPSLVWLSEQRAEFGFSAKGMSLSGRIELKDEAIEIDMDVPLLLRMFQKPAMTILDREVKRLVAESSASEAGPPDQAKSA